LRGGWNAGAAESLGEKVTAMLAQVAPDLRERMVHRWVLTPADLETRYGCTEGSLSHGELALDQFLFMRPVPSCSRYATPLEGYWLCGSGTHPGNASGGGGFLAAREVAASR
jgi:phytoene dehydrogenase-like protein